MNKTICSVTGIFQQHFGLCCQLVTLENIGGGGEWMNKMFCAI